MAKMIGPRKIHRYGNEFKAMAVKLSQFMETQLVGYQNAPVAFEI
jgi:hypothetical protein